MYLCPFSFICPIGHVPIYVPVSSCACVNFNKLCRKNRRCPFGIVATKIRVQKQTVELCPDTDGELELGRKFILHRERFKNKLKRLINKEFRRERKKIDHFTVFHEKILNIVELT